MPCTIPLGFVGEKKVSGKTEWQLGAWETQSGRALELCTKDLCVLQLLCQGLGTVDQEVALTVGVASASALADSPAIGFSTGLSVTSTGLELTRR